MKTTWTKGLTSTDEAIISQQFKEGRVLRRRLSEIIKEKIETKRTSSISNDGYDKPNWAYYQADSVGFERAMKEILSILED